jgi:predicted O-linked N-acetylglucosamine transferase (SPINDLY family)
MGAASAQSRKALERGWALHQKGDLAEAERIYQSVLRRDAGDVGALQLLGLLNAHRGNLEEARQHFDRALGLDPARAELHFLRAEVAGALGMREQSLDGYGQALALRPDYFDVLVNMGNLLLQMERAAEALAALDRAVRIHPDDAAALNNRGNALQALKRHEEALECFDRVLQLLPDNADVLNNRANALMSLGRLDDAEASCDKALALDPRHVHAMLNRGKLQLARGSLAEGLQSFDAALGLKPDYAEAWCDKGMVLTAMRRLEQALPCFDRALALDPGSWHAWNERGIACVLNGQIQDALRCYERASSLQPGNAVPISNRAEALRALGRGVEAREAFEATLRADPEFPYVPGKIAALCMQLSDWRGVAAARARIAAGLRAGERLAEPLDLLLLTDDAEDQLRCARAFALDQYPASQQAARAGEPFRHPRIRVAYLSADFRAHPTSFLLAATVEGHDRSRFETFGISFGPLERSEMAARMAAAFEHFIDVRNLSDSEIVDLLRRNEIDVAVDLMGYTRFGRPAVFASRPCPVQVSYLGYPSTTGSGCMDYIIADTFVIPPGKERRYAESTVRLPDLYQANDPIARDAARVPSRTVLGLPENGIVFCSFNNSAKVAPDMFQAWMQVLGSVEGSVLWLWGGSATTQENLRREAGARGIGAARLVFASWTPYPEHLARLHQADLALDTLPFNGGATTSDALRAGVPVITCPGDAFAARMSGSLLHAIGMPELIASSLDEYKALAIRLATDANLLAATKQKLSANRATHPLFDTDRFRRHLEAAYETMWRRYQNGEPPADFSVEPIGPARN